MTVVKMYAVTGHHPSAAIYVKQGTGCSTCGVAYTPKKPLMIMSWEVLLKLFPISVDSEMQVQAVTTIPLRLSDKDRAEGPWPQAKGLSQGSSPLSLEEVVSPVQRNMQGQTPCEA